MLSVARKNARLMQDPKWPLEIPVITEMVSILSRRRLRLNRHAYLCCSKDMRDPTHIPAIETLTAEHPAGLSSLLHPVFIPWAPITALFSLQAKGTGHIVRSRSPHR
jgi:hypothetical protein